jgi:hypothetical protein
MSTTLSTSFCPVSQPGSNYESVKHFLESDSESIDSEFNQEFWEEYFENSSYGRSETTQPTKTSSMTKYSPTHYKRGKIEVWDFIVDQSLDYLAGNVVKYVCRAGHKNYESELDDWLKVKAYVERKIQQIQETRNS